MAIDTARKRRAAFNFMLTPWAILPLSDGGIDDEDRAMVMGCYFPGAFPSDNGQVIQKTGLAVGLGFGAGK